MPVEGIGLGDVTLRATQQGTGRVMMDLPDKTSGTEPRPQEMGIGGGVEQIDAQAVVGNLQHTCRDESAIAGEFIVIRVALDDGALFDRPVGEGRLIKSGQKLDGASGFDA